MKKVKRLMSVLLILALTLTIVPTEFKGNAVEVNAAVSGIINGGTYTIVSAYNGKAITDTDLYNNFSDCKVWNTSAMSNLARWKVKESGEYYTFTNVGSGKSIKIDGDSKNGSNVDLNGNDNSDRYRWRLIPITSGKYAGSFYIASAIKNENGQEEYAEIISDEDKRDNDGATVRLWTKANSPEEGEPRQIWKLEKTSVENTAFTEEMADTLVEAFKNKHFKKNNDTGYNTLGGGFWGIAEVMEAMLDGYETTGKKVYREMFEGTYNDFIKRNGENWSNNDFNDDIAWAVLDSVRAYLLFGEQRYLNIAKTNYDLMYSRAHRDDGLLIWKMNTDGGTTSCINGPATVAACYLAMATGDDSYYSKARGIFEAWRNSKLYIKDGDDAGHVWDTDSNNWCSTYNQGTFIGAATMLYERYGDQTYYNDACNAVKAVYRYLCNGKILKEERTNSGDLACMRGILMRYMRKFIVDFNRGDDFEFFKINPQVIWMNRNSKNIIQCAWNEKTPEDEKTPEGDSWGAEATYNAISCIANIPTYADELERDAYLTIEAEDMDYTKGLISENSQNTSGGRSLGGVKNGYYTAYYNVNFGSVGASKLKLKYSRAENGSGTIKFRLGSTTGEVIAEATVDSTGAWENWKEITIDTKKKVTGVQNIYVVYEAGTDHVCNFDYFKFEREYVESSAKVKALSYDSQNGISNDPSNIGGTHNGDWVAYNNIDFGNTSPATFKVSYSRNKSGCDSEGYIDVILDDVNNAAVATVKLSSTAPDNWNNYVQIETQLTQAVTGRHTVYLKFRSNGGGNVANVAWFSFQNESGLADAFSKIEAESHDANSGIVNDPDPGNIGSTHSGDWVRYDNIHFADTAKSIRFRQSGNNEAAGTIFIYLDSLDNDPVGDVHFTSTGSGWNEYVEVVGKLSTPIEAGTTHSLYFRFIPDSGKTYVGNFDWFIFYDNEEGEDLPEGAIRVSDKVKVEGYQISATLGGNRVIGSIESEINGKKVEKWGFVYGLLKANGKDSGITDEDMYVGSENQYVKSYESTSVGTLDKQMGASTTATYFVRTMLFPSYTAATFSAEYKVRAYAKLSDGSIVYSDVSEYSIFETASHLYKNTLMNTLDGHQFLYNKILKVVDSNYQEEDYEWGNVIVRPDTW